MRTFALCDAAQMTRVAEHIVQRDFRNGRELVFANLAVDYRTTPLVDAADDSTCDKRQPAACLYCE